MVIKKNNLGGKIIMASQIDTFEMLQIQLEKDVNKIDAFEVAQLQLEKAASIMNLDPNILIQLKEPERVLMVSIPVKMDNGAVKVFTEDISMRFHLLSVREKIFLHPMFILPPRLWVGI